MAKKTPAPPASKPESAETVALTPPKPALVIRAPGVYAITEAEYHADPCVQPSLSRSVLKLMVDKTPAHAFITHPKLAGLDDPASGEADDEAMDYGTAAHEAFLQGHHANIVQLDFRDWRTKDAKAARAETYAAGGIPLLTRSHRRAMRLIDALEEFRRQTGAFTHGKPEQTLIWQEERRWARARVDWLPDDPSEWIWDLKTTAGSASLDAWTRVCFDKGSDIQAAFYPRGAECVRGEPPRGMKFCVIEQKPPFAISVFEMSPIAIGLAEAKIQAGISLWDNCLTTGQWPGYPWETQYIYPPPWVIRSWEDRAALSPRAMDMLREHREAGLGGQFIESGNFGG